MERARGFTLIELLVVIAIISVLSTIALVSLSNTRTKSNAARIIQDFQQLERAMLFFADKEDITKWWNDDDFGLGDEPTIQELIDNTNLSLFLSRAPLPPIGNDYRYAVDGTYDCGGPDPAHGVNLTLSNVPENYFLIIDKIIDSGDGSNCGKIAYKNSNNKIYYKLGRNRDSY